MKRQSKYSRIQVVRSKRKALFDESSASRTDQPVPLVTSTEKSTQKILICLPFILIDVSTVKIASVTCGCIAGLIYLLEMYRDNVERKSLGLCNVTSSYGCIYLEDSFERLNPLKLNNLFQPNCCQKTTIEKCFYS